MNLITRHPDKEIILLWLRDKTSPHTREAYARDIAEFADAVGVVRQITHAVLLDYTESLEGADGTRARKIKTIKSFLSFCAKMNYIPFNVGMAVKVPKIKNTLAQRILVEREVVELARKEKNPRNRLILELLYVAGLRVSELCGLKWEDVIARDGAGQLTVLGKGQKTRQVLIPEYLYKAIMALPQDDERVIPISRQQVWRIVKRAAKKVTSKEVSPHWLRHAHASHALDNGATVQEVAETLGHADVKVTSTYLHARPDRSSALHIKPLTATQSTT